MIVFNRKKDCIKAPLTFLYDVLILLGIPQNSIALRTNSSLHKKALTVNGIPIEVTNHPRFKEQPIYYAHSAEFKKPLEFEYIYHLITFLQEHITTKPEERYQSNPWSLL